jgi:hypothetical protein
MTDWHDRAARRRCELYGDVCKVLRDRDPSHDNVDGARDSEMRLGAWMTWTSLGSG